MKSFAAAATVLGFAATVFADGSAQPTTGVTPQQQSCQAAYTMCGNSYTDAQECSNKYAACQAACKATQATCESSGYGGATCAANAASCLGYNPYTSSSAAPSTMSSAAAPAMVTVTSVVESFVTYCPEATAITTNGNTYTAPAGGYITVTNCPCTITTTVPTGASTPAASSPAVKPATNGTTYSGPKYTGAANKVVGASLSVVAAGAAIFAFAL